MLSCCKCAFFKCYNILTQKGVLGYIFASYLYNMHWVILYIVLKTKCILVTFSGCDCTYFTSKVIQLACYNKNCKNAVNNFLSFIILNSGLNC